jgi:hypothetical protein
MHLGRGRRVHSVPAAASLPGVPAECLPLKDPLGELKSCFIITGM